MEEITQYKNYGEFKTRLDKNIEQQAAGFVEAGYLLKIARDTNILAESGYKSVAEFAQAEYGFTKDLVSRYIAINDRYSVNGYSEELDDKYKGYGFTKLAEMLTLPDSIIEEVSTSLTKDQIRELKKEIKEEEKITDIEVMCEDVEPIEIPCRNLLEKTMYEYLKDHTDIYDSLMNGVMAGDVERILDVLAPSGVAMLTCRIPGTGKIIISIKGADEDLTLINVRTDEKEVITWNTLIMSLMYMFEGKKKEEVYPQSEEKLGKTDNLEEKNEKVAPAQLSKEEKSEPKISEKPISSSDESDFNPIPGQMESICYKCTHWQQCDVKSSITTECNEFEDKTEAYKTDEQRYSEEQDKIDKETAKILRDRADEEKMENLPSDKENLNRIHQIRLAAMYYDDVASGKKSFELRKNDRDYKVGDTLEMQEFKDGRFMGRIIRAKIVYMLENYTGLEEGYCILGTEVEAADE